MKAVFVIYILERSGIFWKYCSYWRGGFLDIFILFFGFFIIEIFYYIVFCVFCYFVFWVFMLFCYLVFYYFNCWVWCLFFVYKFSCYYVFFEVTWFFLWKREEKFLGWKLFFLGFFLKVEDGFIV